MPDAENIRADFIRCGVVSCGGERVQLTVPLRIYVSGPYPGSGADRWCAACPDIDLVCTGPERAHVLGQVEGAVWLALTTHGKGVNPRGQRIAEVLG